MSVKNITQLLANFEAEIESIAEDIKDKRQKLDLAHKDVHDILAQLHDKQGVLAEQGHIADAVKINDMYVHISDFVRDQGLIDNRYQEMKEYLRGTYTIMQQYKKGKEELLDTLKKIDRELKTLNNDASSLLRGVTKPSNLSVPVSGGRKTTRKSKK